jgi:acyl carrier protein
MGMVTMSSLKELQDLIQAKYGLDPATLDAHASMRESGVDSLALVEFLFELEEKFNISIPDDNANLDTLAELAEIVDRLRAGQIAATSE